MHEVYLEREVCDDLRRLPNNVRDRVVEMIRSLAVEPRPQGCRKLRGSHNDYRIRAGDYRDVYGADDAEKRVNVMRVKHRREAYR